MPDDKYQGVNDYAKYESLSKNPIQMAMRLIELEAQFKKHGIHNDPNRRKALIERLKAARELAETDTEAGHAQADDILLEIIDDEAITDIYATIKKWYG